MLVAAFVAAHIFWAHAARVKRRSSSGSDHAQGLEIEHNFELITHNKVNSSGWDVSSSDKALISQITRMLNPPGADSAWRWSEEPSEWTFGLVKLTAQTAKGSLALHMIHRHGLGPLLAGRAGKTFTDFMSNRVKSSGVSDVEFLVESQEEFHAVQKLKSLLESLTLSGLRNLHSYDHQRSVNKWANRVPDCSQESAGGCILQAGMSASAYAFLTGNGFTHTAVRNAKANGEAVLESIGYSSGLDSEDYGNYLQPYHTGDKQYEIDIQQDHRGNLFLVGNVHWENGGLSQGVHISVTHAMVDELESADSSRQVALVEHWFEAHLESRLRQHKSFMRAFRLKVWASEQAEFVEMYAKTLGMP